MPERRLETSEPSHNVERSRPCWEGADTGARATSADFAADAVGDGALSARRWDTNTQVPMSTSTASIVSRDCASVPRSNGKSYFADTFSTAMVATHVAPRVT